MIGWPGTGDFDDHARGEKIAAEDFASGVKGGDARLGQQKCSVPHHLFFSRRGALRQRAKPMPGVRDAGETIFDGQCRLFNCRVELAAALRCGGLWRQDTGRRAPPAGWDGGGIVGWPAGST